MKSLTLQTLDGCINNLKGPFIIWMLCHYPDHVETDERVQLAAEVYRRWKFPIWLFGSSNAHFPEPVEVMTKKKLLALGVPPEDIRISAEFGDITSLDTVQEMHFVTEYARREGVAHVICISNKLHLWQVYAMMKEERERLLFVPSRLRDWRWWYLAVRLTLIPVAHLGIGRDFLPLKFVRHARGRWKWCGF